MADWKGFEIRRATLDDAALLTELARRLFVQTFADANEPDNMDSYLASAFTVEKQTAELSDVDRLTFIAESDGAAIGYAMLCRGRRATGVVADSPAELQRIYVDARWHGHGVGDALMNGCREQARAWACDLLWLGVWQENPRAVAFYKRSGFSTVGEQTFMLGRDLQMDFVMARPLR